MAMKKRFYTVDGQMIGYEEGGVRKDFLTDHLGSIIAIMDENEVRVFDTRYSAYGRNRWITGTSCGFGWVGSYGYRETGLFHMSHYVRARHYSYVTGNWSTVDPLWPQESAYGYVGGRASRWVDPTGAVCGEPIEDCSKDPCAFATKNKQKGLPEDDPCAKKKMDCGDIGGIVCCNGKATICVWEQNMPLAKTKGAKKGKELVIACVKRHEKIHFPGVTCDKKGSHRGGGTDPKYNECVAYKDSIACLKNAVIACGQDVDCLEYVTNEVCRSCFELRDNNCLPLPSICGDGPGGYGCFL